jgi:hypothetical protein
MNAVVAILNAVRRAVQRDLGSFEAIKLTNFFLLVALMAYGAVNSGLEPKSAEPLLLMLGLLVLFPISSDPLARIPASRLALWPLGLAERMGLRIVSFGLSPVVWIVVLLMLLKAGFAAALGFLAFALVVQCLVVLAGRVANVSPVWNFFRHVPQAPGRLGGLIRVNIREMLSVLDTWLAVALCAGGIGYRLMASRQDPAGPAVLATLVALALSTYGQSLFGLDSGAGLTRYRLLPLHGWEILLAKDVAFLSILLLLLIPLNLASGMTAGLIALTFGHYSSVFVQLLLRRWRFTGGRLLPVGALQGITCFTLGIVEQRRGAGVPLLTAIGYLASLFWCGKAWERQTTHRF